MKRIVLVWAVVASLGLIWGCKKQQPAEMPQAPQGQIQAESMMEKAAEAANKAVETAKETVQNWTKEVDLSKSIDQLKAEAEKMDVNALMEMAKKYKDAIAAKEKEFEAIGNKLAAIPMTEKLGAEAQKLTAEAQKITETMKALKERFDVYVAALTAKGGNAAGL